MVGGSSTVGTNSHTPGGPRLRGRSGSSRTIRGPLEPIGILALLLA